MRAHLKRIAIIPFFNIEHTFFSVAAMTSNYPISTKFDLTKVSYSNIKNKPESKIYIGNRFESLESHQGIDLPFDNVNNLININITKERSDEQLYLTNNSAKPIIIANICGSKIDIRVINNQKSKTNSWCIRNGSILFLQYPDEFISRIIYPYGSKHNTFNSLHHSLLDDLFKNSTLQMIFLTDYKTDLYVKIIDNQDNFKFNNINDIKDCLLLDWAYNLSNDENDYNCDRINRICKNTMENSHLLDSDSEEIEYREAIVTSMDNNNVINSNNDKLNEIINSKKRLISEVLEAEEIITKNKKTKTLIKSLEQENNVKFRKIAKLRANIKSFNKTSKYKLTGYYILGGWLGRPILLSIFSLLKELPL